MPEVINLNDPETAEALRKEGDRKTKRAAKAPLKGKKQPDKVVTASGRHISIN